MHSVLWTYLWWYVLLAVGALLGWFARVIWDDWRRPLELPLTPFVTRTERDLDDSRYREATALDGTWRGVRWLPPNHREDA